MSEDPQSAERPPHTRDGSQNDYMSLIGRRRSQRQSYTRDLRTFWIPVFLAAVTSGLTYLLFVGSRGRIDWGSVVAVWLALILVPTLSAFVLSGFRKLIAPITAAACVTTILFAFGVALLSSMRLPLSYVGLMLGWFPLVLIMSYANLRFSSLARGRVGLLSFASADRLMPILGSHVVLVTDPERQIDELDTVLIDGNEHHTPEWARLLNECYLRGIDIVPWHRYLEIRLGMSDVGSFEVHHIAYGPGQILYIRLKRLFDIVAVLLALPVALLVGIVVALCILVLDGRPVVFKQPRLGFAGRPFTIYKFRTMRKGMHFGAVQENDRRILPGMSFLRRWRVDELPQFYNILNGDMSLIGPRPEAVDLAHLYETTIPEYVHRLLVLPGLTGWAQVNNGYTSNPDEARQKLSYDLYYIKNLSFDLDILIVFRTVRTLLLGSGAR